MIMTSQDLKQTIEAHAKWWRGEADGMEPTSMEPTSMEPTSMEPTSVEPRTYTN